MYEIHVKDKQILKKVPLIYKSTTKHYLNNAFSRKLNLSIMEFELIVSTSSLSI